MEMLNREQNAMAQFMQSSEKMRQIADDGHGKGLLELTDALLQAMTSFGMSEMNARKAERREAIKIQQDVVKLVSKETDYYHKKGLKSLSHAHKGLEQFREDLQKYKEELGAQFEVDISEDLDKLHHDLRKGLVDLDIKASDVKKLDGAIQECFNSVRSKSPESLIDYIESKLRELEKIRNRPDRGAVENIPIWKVVAIVAALGIWVWALFRCHWWGSCSLAEGLSYFILFWIAVYIARFC